jgi:homeobox-leucine zipper protein
VLICSILLYIFGSINYDFDYGFQMQAEVQVPSPLVPVRQYSFLRFAKQHVGGIWVVVDVSVNVGRNAANGNTYMSCKKLPSGCILEDLPNGFCKVSA